MVAIARWHGAVTVRPVIDSVLWIGGYDSMQLSCVLERVCLIVDRHDKHLSGSLAWQMHTACHS